jgi:thiol-disulfide isomerase/thioredoxin
MTEETTQIQAPDLVGGYWLNGEPLSIESLRGKAVLIDFWDYTCVNCVRTLPYVIEWGRRYQQYGLAVIGVHAPEFSFAKELAGVQEAIKAFGIEYSVVMDNGFSIWRAYANRYWPAKYLVDKDGYIRYYHFGEGAYEETELAIQGLLREISPDVLLPAPMSPMRDMDAPGAACYRVTPELYLGYQRGRIGNPRGYIAGETATYEDQGPHAEGFFYLTGEWKADEEYVMKPWSGSSSHSSVSIRYTGKEVNLVVNPLLGRTCRAYLAQDGAPLPREAAGEDARFEDGGRAYIDVGSPRMYRLVDNPEIGSHDLTLSTETPGLALYAFTFVSCVAA